MSGYVSEKTWIPASILILAVGGAIGATWFVAGVTGRVGSVENEQVNSRARMDVVEAKIDAMAKDVADVATTLRERTIDFVTARDMRTWRRQLAHDNPTLLIPEWDK